MVHDDLFDYYSPEFRNDPYPFYRRLREQDPVHWGLPYEPFFEGAWHVAAYDDVVAILKDPRFGKAAGMDQRLASVPVEAQEYLGLLNLALLRTDPPDHTRLRTLVSKAFTPRMVENLRPRVQAIAASLLDVADATDASDASDARDASDATGEMDLIDQYAFPLSITVITEMLGLDYDDRDQLKHWAAALVAAQEFKRTTEVFGPAAQAGREIVAFFHEQIARQRQHPRPGILGDLLAVHDEHGDRLSEPELIVTCTLLLVAGHDTTVNLIGNGMLALLCHPEQLAKLRAQPALIGPAVEEFLRYDASSQMTGRIAHEDVEVHGKVIHRGDQVNLLLGSANHDDAHFANPDEVDITRQDNKHIAFGHGIHYCLGAPLARLEAQIAIPALLERRPHLELAATPERRDTIGFRGLKHLPVAG